MLDVDTHLKRFGYAYQTGVLDPERHYRLVEDHRYFAERAGIAPEYIWTPAEGLLGEDEIKYAKNVKTGSEVGLIYTGRFDPPVELRMSAMAGLFMRNFLTCRVMTAEELVSEHMRGIEGRDPFALFLYGLTSGKGKATGIRAQIVTPLIQTRARQGRQTIVEIPTIQRLEDVYGGDLMHHFSNYPYATVDQLNGS